MKLLETSHASFHVHNMSRIIHFDLGLPRGRFPRIWCFEDRLQLFQSLARGLNEEEVDNDQLDTNPANIDQVLTTMATLRKRKLRPEPLARVLFSRHSTAYRVCKGVQPQAKQIPNK
ncbi:hypothetical protein AC578_3406 [Pseudocercospora eumusae]|uniref:Uncharacterized protein n=1 Tax=Pseudocercospora eumusae TaxID=321146 RepID=A0A139GUI1_9PEZI|nr:hypothetical protein AC578_3406 [Pseudocercospora eumusae]